MNNVNMAICVILTLVAGCGAAGNTVIVERGHTAEVSGGKLKIYVKNLTTKANYMLRRVTINKITDGDGTVYTDNELSVGIVSDGDAKDKCLIFLRRGEGIEVKMPTPVTYDITVMSDGSRWELSGVTKR